MFRGFNVGGIHNILSSDLWKKVSQIKHYIVLGLYCEKQAGINTQPVSASFVYVVLLFRLLLCFAL